MIGSHWIIEFFGCPNSILDNPVLLGEIMYKACAASDLSIIKQVEHSFTPHGVTMLALLSESHMSIHTWPEEGYCALDIFSCGQKNLQAAFDILRAEISPASHSVKVINRGGSLSENRVTGT
jgi:S-adenosylmethionine decarboxylase